MFRRLHCKSEAYNVNLIAGVRVGSSFEDGFVLVY